MHELHCTRATKAWSSNSVKVVEFRATTTGYTDAPLFLLQVLDILVDNFAPSPTVDSNHFLAQNFPVKFRGLATHVQHSRWPGLHCATEYFGGI
jgi:hypothetical protein